MTPYNHICVKIFDNLDTFPRSPGPAMYSVSTYSKNQADKTVKIIQITLNNLKWTVLHKPIYGNGILDHIVDDFGDTHLVYKLPHNIYMCRYNYFKHGCFFED